MSRIPGTFLRAKWALRHFRSQQRYRWIAFKFWAEDVAISFAQPFLESSSSVREKFYAYRERCWREAAYKPTFRDFVKYEVIRKIPTYAKVLFAVLAASSFWLLLRIAVEVLQ